MLKPRVLASAVVAGSLLVGAGAAQAGVFGFNFSGTCAEACAGNAVVTTAAGSLTVVLTNTQADVRSAGDLISDFHITPNVALTAGSLALTQTGSLITVTSNTGPYATSPGPPTHWEASQTTTQINLDTFSGAQPINMIIGPPDGSGNYANGNGSITNGTFSPYINQTGTFVVTDAAITAATLINSVVFSFGTSLNEFTQPGTPCTPGTPNCGSGPPLIPEPGTLALLGSGLVMYGIIRRRKPI